MGEKWKRISTDTGLMALIVGVSVGVSYYYFGVTGWKNIWLWVGSLLTGLVLGEHRWIWRWVVNIISAAKILIKGENNPKIYIHPNIEDIDFFPNKSWGIDLDYITIILNWTSMLHKSIKITDITGKVRIDGSHPPDEFSRKESLVLKANDYAVCSESITLEIKRDALYIVKRMRQEKRGSGSIDIELTVKLDDKYVTTYKLSKGFKYVGI